MTGFNSVDATYRADLRELNELNFARFDAKVEQRLSVLEARMERRQASLELKLEHQLSDVRKEIASLRQETRDSIAALRAELIKWSFVFFATAALAVIGLR